VEAGDYLRVYTTKAEKQREDKIPNSDFVRQWHYLLYFMDVKPGLLW